MFRREGATCAKALWWEEQQEGQRGPSEERQKAVSNGNGLDQACLISPEHKCGFGFKGGSVVSGGLA